MFSPELALDYVVGGKGYSVGVRVEWVDVFRIYLIPSLINVSARSI